LLTLLSFWLQTLALVAVRLPFLKIYSLHGLKTPIMRRKLRTELLDDEVMRGEFHEDLDDLDVMVKSA
jgi:hypothetical protein